MSVVHQVFWEGSRVISPAAWAEAIRREGFEMDLDPEIDPAEHAGYVPCRFRGRRAGFELYIGDARAYREDLRAGDVDLEEDAWVVIGPRDRMADLVTHARFDELASAVVAAGVLASLVDGIVREDATGRLVRAAESITWARDALRAMEADLAREAPLG